MEQGLGETTEGQQRKIRENERREEALTRKLDAEDTRVELEKEIGHPEPGTSGDNETPAADERPK